MPIVLALTAAAVWGAGDFLGGVASRRIRTEQVLFISQAVGLAALLIAVLVIPGAPARSDLLWGAAGGILGTAGLYGLYGQLAKGAASVVAPTTAVSAALTPVVVGLALGETPGALTMTGVAIALVAVGLLAGGEGHHADPGAALTVKIRRAINRSFWVAIASGLGFGAFYVCLAQTSQEAGLWPLVAAKASAVIGLAMIPSVWKGIGRSPGGAVRVAAVAGVLDSAANAAYITAVRAGSLTWVPVISSLYPASTVLLARVFQKQRLGRLHIAGLVLALLAIALVTAGSG